MHGYGREHPIKNKAYLPLKNENSVEYKKRMNAIMTDQETLIRVKNSVPQDEVEEIIEVFEDDDLNNAYSEQYDAESQQEY